MNEKEWMSIPVLPCTSLGDTLDFWENLGYTVSYRQDKPYPYGVVEQGGYQLHFSRVKGFGPGSAYYVCLVMVSDVERVHAAFCTCLKKQLGKVSSAGLPRISRMRPGQTRFTLTDVSGNAIIFIQLGQGDQEAFEKADEADLSALQKKIRIALRFRDYKEDFPAAAKTLDTALKQAEGEAVADIAEALIIRAELAGAEGDEAIVDLCENRLAILQMDNNLLNTLRLKHRGHI